MASTLHIAEGLDLPLDAITETFAFLAKRGAGKTHNASVLAEEMLTAGGQVIVLDPLDVWWGLRSSADGKGPGHPIAILGGSHGDIPLEPTVGGFIADLLVREQLSAVLVLAEWSKADQRRFAADFGEQLFRLNTEPVHLILEEADIFAPQRPLPGEQRMLGAYEQIVRRGRSKGIGCSLVTQRSAVLHKDVLTQTEVLVAMRTPSKHDRAAIKDWFDAHDAEEVAAVMQTVPSLATGEAWVSSPYWLGVLQRVQWRRRHTWDSSSTPKVGERRHVVRTFADVDLAAIKEQMADTIEKAKADDPTELKRRIRDLEQQLAAVQAATPEPVVEHVEVPVLDEGLVLRLEQALEPATRLMADVQDRLTWETTLLEDTDEIQFQRRRRDDRQDVPRARPARDRPRQVGAPGPQERPDPPARREPRRPTVPGPEAPTGSLTPSDRKILAALAQYDTGRSRRQVALLTGYKESGGRFSNLISALRSRGLITGGRDQLTITGDGLEALGHFDPLPTGPDLGRHWTLKLPPSEGRVLTCLLDAWPAALAKADLATATGYTATGGRFSNILSRLRTLGLIEGTTDIRAADELAHGGTA